MSASSKKKLRREQEAAKMTEKQLTAQKEAKKISLYTMAFVVVMVVLLVIAITVGVKQTITSSGIREKNTVAMTVGDHEINNVEMNYFYMDNVNNFYASYGSYASMFGLDVTKPLNEQVVDEETGLTWADDFLNAAKSNVQTVYAMVDAAEAAGYALSNEERTEVEYNIHNMDAMATMYGYASGDDYIKAMYGNGADLDSYLEYALRTKLAQSYSNYYAESLTYDDAALRAKEAENFGAYSAYSFNSYYLAASRFLTGGTTNEDGTTTYSDEEKAASVAAAEEAAKSLVAQEILTVDDLNAAIAALSINAESTTATSTSNKNVQAGSINSMYAEWVTSESRKAGDKATFANVTTDTEGNETVSGYYVVFFNGSTDNAFPMANVRHILVSFAHDETETEGHDHSGATYTDAEKAAAKAEAEALLAQWNGGDKTEDSFAELANAESDDGDGTTGGLYENVYPGQMVVNFNDWCFDESRKSGDTGIVETEYGYHVMYYVGQTETTYRDFLIENDLRSTEVNEWYNSTIEAMPITDGDVKFLSLDLVLNPAA